MASLGASYWWAVIYCPLWELLIGGLSHLQSLTEASHWWVQPVAPHRIRGCANLLLSKERDGRETLVTHKALFNKDLVM